MRGIGDSGRTRRYGMPRSRYQERAERKVVMSAVMRSLTPFSRTTEARGRFRLGLPKGSQSTMRGV